ncbi:integrator complex subunit 6-like isoform X2 [Oscarella lobularis]|uniref:integrator complex subunit 6-like isoform X2 n=1 Tax=Oscarella lobularis TaxID=121494 RepID=UPI003313FDA9
MGIVLFLVDNSASMNERTYAGTNLLDIAKTAVDNFVKIRSRDPASRQDRYMLVTYDSPPFCFKSGWRESHAIFSTELKNMIASGLSNFGDALQRAFDLLNIHRLQTGIDNYGQGRNPFYLEPAAIVAITDGGHSIESLDSSTSQLCGKELTKEGFRWDQRLFMLHLQYPGFLATSQDPAGDADPNLSQLCEMTGGRYYSVISSKTLNQGLESLVQKLQPGVVLQFEKMTSGLLAQSVAENAPNLVPGIRDSPVPMEIDAERRTPTLDLLRLSNGGTNNVILSSGGDSSTSTTVWEKCRRMIYVRSNPKTGVPGGHWPIPESFWPDQNTQTLAPRSAHPVILFSCEDSPPMVIDNLPFDKYELEASPLTQHILERKSPQACWKVYVQGSGKTAESVYPFGYLKPSTNLQCVNLLVMPYNYVVALPLLDDLIRKYKMKPPRGWKQEFDKYLSTLPLYYFQPLRSALRLMGAPSGIMPENHTGGLSLEVAGYLKKLKKQAQLDGSKILTAIASKPSHNDAGQSLGSDGLPTKESIVLQCHRNPFDIPRRDLFDQLHQMRMILLSGSTKDVTTAIAGDRHSVPIGQMGNYQEFRRTHYFLREIEENPERKTQLFGNPYRIEKATDKAALPDEANEAMVGIGINSRKQINRKRRRSTTPPASPQPSRKTGGPGEQEMGRSKADDVVASKGTPTQRTASAGANSVETSKGLDNSALKNIIIKELRQFRTKNYSVVFEHLDLVKGSVDVRKTFLQEIIKVANSFKKKTLVQQLEKWGQERRLTRTEVRS